MGALAEEILSELVDALFHPYKIVYGSIPKEISRKSARITIHRLEKKGFIERGIRENEVCIRLTEKGLEELARRKQREKEKKILNKLKEEKWDGCFRVVIFDIPEENKRIRNVLRQTLKVLEFKPLQKSVWISKKNYTKELREWVRELNLLKFILIFETRDLGIKYVT